MITERAYAKINLYLDVLSRREDGFHDIKSVMHTLSLADELTLSVTPSDTPEITLEIVGAENLTAGDGNLIVKAAKAYFDRTGISAKACVTLKKNIPISAGLAGGSSDAAATLRALNRHFGLMSESDMLTLAASVGSDVPFCYVGGTALCEGRGERMLAMPSPRDCRFVVAIGDDRVSTADAYSALDREYNGFCGKGSDGDCYFEKLETALAHGILPNELFNIFESVVVPTAPSVEAIKSKLLKCGAKCALMSGSGPSVFGIFDDEASARAAEKELRNDGFFAFSAKNAGQK